MSNERIQQTIAALRAQLGDDAVRTGDAIGADYAHDETPNGTACVPDAVCLAKCTEDVAAVLRLCSENGVPVTTRGAGTSLVGGPVAVHGGIVLAMAGMNAIIEYDDDAMEARVQPGVLLADFKADAAARGYLYAPDPGEKTATLGGNAATNAGGPCAIRYGTTRDHVLAATVVLPTGEILRLSSSGVKSNSGYDLLQLVLGSEGTLGVITELTLKLDPKPKADVSLILPFADAESVPAAVQALQQSELRLQSMEYLDTDLVEFAGTVTGNPVFPVTVEGERPAASLLVTIEGEDDDALDAAMERVAEMSEEWGVLDILVVDTPNLKKDVWAAHDAFHTATESVLYADELNMAVPPMELPAFIESVKALGAQQGLDVYAYGHAGDGGVHIYVCANDGDREAFLTKREAVFDAAYAACRTLGGAVSSEHGVGYLKKKYLKEFVGEDAYALMGRIKAAFDPKGILNPGKVVETC